ncbi:MAG: hypothetical protein LBQ60_18755 [Bacteroidales bacterium]|jgi:hypothetical protein|nr:hypothetical protein [Bacteroidales bacterium]
MYYKNSNNKRGLLSIGLIYYFLSWKINISYAKSYSHSRASIISTKNEAINDIFTEPEKNIGFSSAKDEKKNTEKSIRLNTVKKTVFDVFNKLMSEMNVVIRERDQKIATSMNDGLSTFVANEKSISAFFII